MLIPHRMLFKGIFVIRSYHIHITHREKCCRSFLCLTMHIIFTKSSAQLHPKGKSPNLSDGHSYLQTIPQRNINNVGWHCITQGRNCLFRLFHITSDPGINMGIVLIWFRKFRFHVVWPIHTDINKSDGSKCGLIGVTFMTSVTVAWAMVCNERLCLHG